MRKEVGWMDVALPAWAGDKVNGRGGGAGRLAAGEAAVRQAELSIILSIANILQKA